MKMGKKKSSVPIPAPRQRSAMDASASSSGRGEEAGGEQIAPGVRVPPALLRYEASRSSGPGGQNVNKRSTRMQLRIRIEDLPIPPDARSRLRRLAGSQVVGDDELLISADEKRTQLGNRKVCAERLRELIVRAMVRPKRRVPTRPTRGGIERRLQEKREQSDRKRRRKWDADR